MSAFLSLAVPLPPPAAIFNFFSPVMAAAAAAASLAAAEHTSSALYAHIVAASEAAIVLGADIAGALGELCASDCFLPARPWLPHAQGLVAVARVGGVRMLRSRDAVCGEKLVFAVLLGGASEPAAAAPTEAEMLDWELRAAWSSPLPGGHDFEEHVDYEGRAVYLIAPTRLLSSLTGYLRLYLGLYRPSRPSPFLAPVPGGGFLC